MAYSAQTIRNVCLLGHSGNGKTTLVESMNLVTGSIDRLGKTSDGNTICDYDAEEIKRQVSVYAAIAPVEYNGTKINVMDTPGNFDFAGEARECLRVADLGIIVTDAKSGVSVGTERAWKLLNERKLPRFIYIGKTDEENGDFAAAFQALKDKFGTPVVQLYTPITDGGKKITGLIDIAHKKAYELKGNKMAEIAMPADQAGDIDELYDALMESVAETSEELMEKYFGGEEFTQAEINEGLKAGVKEGTLVPVFYGSAFSNLGTEALLKACVDYAPTPLDGVAEKATNDDGDAIDFVVDPNGPATAFVFKTYSDQYGKYSYAKVMSGSLVPDMPLVNARTGDTDKLGRLYYVKGKKTTETKEVCCGDICAIAKMDKLKTGDALCTASDIVKFNGFGFAQPTYQKAIAPKTRGQEDKVAAGLTRLNEEDPTFTVYSNAETHQTVITAVGDIQLDVITSKLKSRFNVETELNDAKVAYRECIRKKVKVQGRHKKQTGGSGQFGDVWIEFEPGEQEEMEFCENVFGGSVPKNFFPAVEKGLREACVKGPLAGYPVVNLKCTLVDGSYHPVDSSEIAFKTAAQLAYKAGMPQAGPTLLEPVGTLKVTIPDSYTGDIMGDLSKRRGRVMGMNPTGDGDTVIEAEVPMAETTTYAIDLRAMTQSRGAFEISFNRYEEAPREVQQKVIEEASKAEE